MDQGKCMNSTHMAGALLAGLFCAVTLSAHAADDIRITAKQIQALGIEVAPLVKQAGATGSGMPAQVVIPNGQVQVVSAPLAGLAQSVAVAANDSVKKGQVLAHLASPMLIESQREYLQAATQAQLSRNSLNRDEQLFKEGIIAEGRYLATKSAAIQAAAGVSERRQALRLYGMSEASINRLQSSHVMSSTLEIVSPIDGVVLEQMVTAGQRVEAAAPLYKVARLSPLWLEIQMPASGVSGIAVGATVSIKAYGAKGKVLSVGRNVSANQTVMVRAEITDGIQNLHAGQYIEAVIAVVEPASSVKQWHVPSSALARNQEKAFLFVQTPAGFHAQPVTILNQSADSSAVSGELKDGDRIAVKGVAALKATWMGLGGGE